MADDPTDPPEPAKDDPAPEPTDPPADPEPDEPEYPDDLGDAGKKALDAERKARRDAEAKLKELEPLAAKAKELEDAQKTEQQKLAEQLDAAKAEGGTAKAEAARLRAAIKYGLTEDDLELLEGVPAEQVEDRAKRLAERFAAAEGTQPVVPPSRTQGGGGGAPEVDLDKVVNAIPPA